MADKEPKAKETQPNEFVEMSLLKEIDRAGGPAQRKN
jgi:hypothetical protein